MKKVCSLAMMIVAAPAVANPYVFGRVGVSDFVVNTTQYAYMPDSTLRSTVVDGKIDDVNATYHVGLGYDFDIVRVDAEYSYGHYKIDGNFHMLGDNPGFGKPDVATTPYLGYLSSYELTDSVHTLTLNAHVDVFRFGRRFGRQVYTSYGDTGELVGFNSIFLTGGLGYAYISEKGRVVIDTGDVWPGGPAYHVSADDKSSHFTYNLGGGVSFWLVQNLHLDIEYRYSNFGKMSEGLTSRKYSSHELSAGLRYAF